MKMQSTEIDAVIALNRQYFLDYPREAIQKLESMSIKDTVDALLAQRSDVLILIWQYFANDVAEKIFERLPQKSQTLLLTELDPTLSVQLLGRFPRQLVEKYLSPLEKSIADELRTLLQFPEDSAGHLMDPRIIGLREQMTVAQAQEKLRAHKPKALQEVFVIDESGMPVGAVALQDIAISDLDARISDLMSNIKAVAQDTSPREEVIEIINRHKLNSVPVINVHGKLVGVIRESTLITALQEEASVDIQTMVGVSKDERALSSAKFAVIKRLPWLQINLLTAFLAASVVGLFESTIAQFTALAVLLPVVAGQSGNAGAQALAVTMRGLALREISIRHWPRVVLKEVNVGFMNGIAIALTTSLCVYFWSQSLGLAMVIAIAMVVSMVAAGFSGAIIPISLRRLGQDPAQSSSIILTTVTDVVGFFSFLGTATALSFML